MGKEKRPEASVDESAARWRWFDGMIRLLMLAAFIAFAVSAVWQFRLIREQLDRIEEHRVERMHWRLTRSGTTPELRKEAFLGLVAAGNTEWRMAYLNDLDLKKAILNGVSLKHAQFKASKFHDTQMYGIDLFRAQFETCDFSGANLERADLREARIFRSTLKGVNFRHAKLASADLEQSTFRKCKFFNARMPEARLLLARFEDCDLTSVDLTAADLTNAEFIRTNLRSARLPQAQLQNTKFTDSNWWRIRGLTPLAIENYKRQFAPTQHAPKEFREDYELWLAEGRQ